MLVLLSPAAICQFTTIAQNWQSCEIVVFYFWVPSWYRGVNITNSSPNYNSSTTLFGTDWKHLNTRTAQGFDARFVRMFNFIHTSIATIDVILAKLILATAGKVVFLRVVALLGAKLRHSELQRKKRHGWRRSLSMTCSLTLSYTWTIDTVLFYSSFYTSFELNT